MKIDIEIGWDDLSRECKEKIKMLHRVSKGTDVKIKYPDANKMYAYYDKHGDSTGQGFSIGNDTDRNSIFITRNQYNSGALFSSNNSTVSSQPDVNTPQG